MLLTTNYNLKKPEGTDTVNIDDLNGNFDIIDEKLFAVIKAWEDFKASGGKINGELLLKGLTEGDYSLKINGRTIEAIGEGLALKAPGCEALYYYYNTNYKKPVLLPAINEGVHLGQHDKRFADMWLSVDVKNSGAMCSKLPNGNIIQSGRIDTRTAKSYRVTFPIAFPNKCCSVVATYDSNTHGNILTQNVNLHFFDVVIDKDDANGTVSWIAIGY